MRILNFGGWFAAEARSYAGGKAAAGHEIATDTRHGVGACRMIDILQAVPQPRMTQSGAMTPLGASETSRTKALHVMWFRAGRCLDYQIARHQSAPMYNV
jgi:hypothetical protein